MKFSFTVDAMNELAGIVAGFKSLANMAESCDEKKQVLQAVEYTKALLRWVRAAHLAEVGAGFDGVIYELIAMRDYLQEILNADDDVTK